jgi:hypothetical protein
MKRAMNDRHATTGDVGPSSPSRPVPAGGQEDQTLDASPIAEVRSPPPANDSPTCAVAVLTLIDDLAELAAALYFAGRLRGDDDESRPRLTG